MRRGAPRFSEASSRLPPGACQRPPRVGAVASRTSPRVSDEDLVTYLDTVANERMTLNLAPLSDPYASLNLDERADARARSRSSCRRQDPERSTTTPSPNSTSTMTRFGATLTGALATGEEPAHPVTDCRDLCR